MQINGKELEFDNNGFLIDPDLWDEDVAVVIARNQGIDNMTDQHWEIVRFIRHYWTENQEAPSARLISREFNISSRQIYSLFPQGPNRGAACIAGLKKPEGCV